ncbi:MAG TPA: protein kinase [Chitinophagaceae bacterium]|nr:protein kinase [Chitinophagaceae bacterium]
MSYSIFVSYRRADNPIAVKLLVKYLQDKFGEDGVFFDINVEPGKPWPEEIKTALKEAKIFLAVIGRAWLGKMESGELRIQEKDDWVKLEVEVGLNKAVPVFIDVEIPRKTDGLPEPVRQLLDLQGYTINFNGNEESEIEALLVFLESKLQSLETKDDFRNRLQKALADKYKITNSIGSGQRANVYLGRDVGLDRDVAIKAITDMELNSDFVNALKVAARISDNVPNSIAILGAYVKRNPFHVIMPYLPGGTLRKKIDEEGSPFSGNFTREKLLEIGDALVRIHECVRSAHGNVKPSNVVLNHNGKPYLNPFSIAPALTKKAVLDKLSGISFSSRSSLDKEELYYVAPELFDRNSDKTGQKIDQYMLGIIGYELLMGNIPETHTGIDDLREHGIEAFKDVETIKDKRKDCPSAFSDIIHKMIDYNPDNRFDFLEDAIFEMKKISFDDIEIAKASYARCLEKDNSGNHFFRTFYNQLIQILPETEAAKFKEKKIGELETHDQYKILREAIFILLMFAEDKRRIEPNVLSRIAERHGGGDKQLNIFPRSYDMFRDVLIKVICGSPPGFENAFDSRCQSRHERGIIEKAWRNALEPGINYMKQS